MDWTIDRVAPYWAESTIKRGLDQLIEYAERLAETQAGQLLSAMLAPPEPPRETVNEQATEEDSSDNPTQDQPDQ